MQITIRALTRKDIEQTVDVWNEVVGDGAAFPQTELLNPQTGADFFFSQTYTGVAVEENNHVAGLYILHPNNVGRCGHICNASYAVRKDMRSGHIGEQLVRHCMQQAASEGFRILQFNAVAADNIPALRLYKKLGFTQMGTVPGGFLMDDGTYKDIIPHYIELK